jgi:FlaA1/EpsC-like NDP-sugar epimerase
MKNLIRSRNFYIMVLCDAVLVGAAYFLSFYLRFEGQIPEGFLNLFQQTVALVVVTNIAVFFVFNMYRGMWRFTSLNDLKNVVAATLLSSLAIPL